MPKEFIKLTGGDPDVEAPKWVIDAALSAIREGGRWTHYAGSEIPMKFREAVVDYYKIFGPEYEPENIIPTAGSSAALYISLASVLREGDEVLMWSPSFAGHYRILRELGVKASIAPLLRETGYHPHLDALEDHVSPDTKAILICNPNNPTGTVFTEKELRTIGDIALDYELTVFSDEIYLHFVYDDNRFVSTAFLEGLKERTFNIMSFSKTFSMTGWRLGYTIVPEKCIEKATKIARITAPKPATFVYAAGIAALRGDMSYVEERKQAYDKRRRYFCKAVDDIDGLSCHLFEGAFYAWFDARSYGLGSEEFCRRLQEEENVALSPGHRFGVNTNGFIRVPLVQPMEILEDVIERLSRFVHSL
ncbi:MAG: aminotransferase class I/II-fold pyridoxal phosphate-dependent enzyme [Candidatus Bathyarchaeota archaeon]|nr:MAG: aminotransferase class I/II-fold pyridoxal phosphate-dependent enzyme [Candidatus Bathyarchaeota archaeon]